MNTRNFTTKQMGDACEMLIAAEMTLAGVPAMKAPDFWPGYDVVAQPLEQSLQRISVKARTYKKGSAFVDYRAPDVFDWLAIVLLPGEGSAERRCFLVPRDVVDENARTYSGSGVKQVREFRIDEIVQLFLDYENNFGLRREGLSAKPRTIGRRPRSAAATNAPNAGA